MVERVGFCDWVLTGTDRISYRFLQEGVGSDVNGRALASVLI